MLIVAEVVDFTTKLNSSSKGRICESYLTVSGEGKGLNNNEEAATLVVVGNYYTGEYSARLYDPRHLHILRLML